MTTSSCYFATIRPAAGFIIPESHAAIEEYLTKNCKSAILSVEKEGHQTHIHFCFITNEPKRKDSVLRSIKTITSKFYLNAQINLKIALDEGAYFYTIKDGNIVFDLFPEDMLAYIEKDYERSLQVIEENTDYKNSVQKYAYSNRATWQPFFDNLKKHSKHMTLEQWKTYVFMKLGTLANSEFMWDLYFTQYKQHSNGISQKIHEEYSRYEKVPNNKKRKISEAFSQSSCSETESETEEYASTTDSESSSSDEYLKHRV